MKIIVLTILLSSICVSSNAQILKNITRKIEKKIEHKADDLLQKEDAEKDTDKSTIGRAISVFDFHPGDSIILEDNFMEESLGKMPNLWKTSGTGELVTFPDAKGKWLLLNEFTTYKLDTLIALPYNFTIEFDILTRADQAKDLNAFSFGLARDNSVAGYEDRIITKTTLHYWNQEIINSSNDFDLYNTQDFKLGNYANAIMHVSIQVNGEMMKVFLNKIKVLDAKMVDTENPKYFYFNPSTNLDNHAQIAVSNFRIAE